jgi:hypothetical protein
MGLHIRTNPLPGRELLERQEVEREDGKSGRALPRRARNNTKRNRDRDSFLNGYSLSEGHRDDG